MPPKPLVQAPVSAEQVHYLSLTQTLAEIEESPPPGKPLAVVRTCQAHYTVVTESGDPIGGNRAVVVALTPDLANAVNRLYQAAVDAANEQEGT